MGWGSVGSMTASIRACIVAVLLLMASAAQAQTGEVPFLIRFSGSVRGLAAGAPVEIMGIRIGTVRSVGLELAPGGDGFAVPVRIDLTPATFPAAPGLPRPGTAEEVYAAADALVRRGLRAQIGSTQLMGGDALITLAFVPGQPPTGLDRTGPVPALPAGPAMRDAVAERLRPLLDRLAALPVDDLFGQLLAASTAMRQLATGPELRDSLAELRAASADLRVVLKDVGPRMDTVFDGLNQTVRNANGTIAALNLQVNDRSPLLTELRGMLRELQGAARSLRLMAEYLERNPNALITGKSDNRR